MASSRIIKTGLSILSGSGFNIALQLVSVPVLISAWGVQKYGEWLILYTIPGYLAMSDFGIINVANNKIDHLCAVGRLTSARKIYAAASSLLIKMLLAFLLITALAGLASWKFELVEFSTLRGVELLATALVLIIDSLILVLSLYQFALFRSVGKQYVSVNLNTISRIGSLMALLLIAYAGGEPALAALGSVICKLLVLFFARKKIRSEILWVNAKEKWHAYHTKYLVKLTSSYVLLPASNIAYLHMTTLAVGAYLGAQQVVVFNTIRTFTRLSSQVIGIVGQSAWSEFTKLHSRREYMQMHYLARKIFFFAIASALFIFIAYAVGGIKFYDLWTAKKIVVPKVFFLWMVTNSCLIGVYTAMEVLLLSTNSHRTYSKIFFYCVISQVLISLFFIPYLGISSVPIFGSLFSLLIIVFIAYNSRKLIGANDA